jgi:hypothetical protein
MSYMQDLEKEMQELLGDVPLAKRTAVIARIKARELASYRNGVAVGIEQGTDANRDYERQKLADNRHEKRSAANAPARPKGYYTPYQPKR